MPIDRLLLGLGYRYLLPLIKQQLLSQSQPQEAQPKVQYQVLSDKDKALLNLKGKDGAVIVLIGTRDTGKTELAYRLAEFLGKPTYAISPEQNPHPAFIERIKPDEIDEKVRPHSTLICDDLPVYMSNRDYFDSMVRALERMIPMVRHERKMHLIFSSQSSAQADRYILDCDMAFFKPLGLLYSDLERPNISKIYKKFVDREFEGRGDDWIHKHAYMWSREFRGIITVAKVTNPKISVDKPGSPLDNPGNPGNPNEHSTTYYPGPDNPDND